MPPFFFFLLSSGPSSQSSRRRSRPPRPTNRLPCTSEKGYPIKELPADPPHTSGYHVHCLRPRRFHPPHRKHPRPSPSLARLNPCRNSPLLRTRLLPSNAEVSPQLRPLHLLLASPPINSIPSANTITLLHGLPTLPASKYTVSKV